MLGSHVSLKRNINYSYVRNACGAKGPDFSIKVFCFLSVDNNSNCNDTNNIVSEEVLFKEEAKQCIIRQENFVIQRAFISVSQCPHIDVFTCV